MSLFYARTLHHLDRIVFRVTSGRATFVSWMAGLPVVMLTTTGARSGRRSTLPLVALPAGDRANPRATVCFEGVTREVEARTGGSLSWS